jgi:hypothetical protein
MEIAMVVPMRIVGLAEGHAEADDITRPVRPIELRSVQVIAAKENRVSRREIEAEGLTKPNAIFDVSVLEGVLVVVLLGKDREAVALPDGSDGDPDVDRVVRTIDPLIPVGPMRGNLACPLFFANLLNSR